MNPIVVERGVRISQALALVLLPALWLLMFALHFRSLADFFTFHAAYTPAPAADQVSRLIAAHNRAPLLHDQHMIGYLSLPLLILAAFGLFAAGRRSSPALATVGIALTVSGTVFLGGVFGLFTAVYRGIGSLESRFSEGAIATFSAVTASNDAYGLTRTLAQLALLGLAVQGIALRGVSGVPARTCVFIVLGCALFLLFWDVDNMMFLGTVFLAAGFLPVARELARSQAQPETHGSQYP